MRNLAAAGACDVGAEGLGCVTAMLQRHGAVGQDGLGCVTAMLQRAFDRVTRRAYLQAMSSWR